MLRHLIFSLSSESFLAAWGHYISLRWLLINSSLKILIAFGLGLILLPGSVSDLLIIYLIKKFYWLGLERWFSG